VSRHRQEPVRRAAVRPRYGRLAVLGASVSVTGIAMLGGLGVLPSVAVADEHPERSRTPVSVLAGAVSSSEPTAAAAPTASATPEVDPLAVPADSGTGRRAVFSQGEQRVWLVRANGSVARTYPVSGSVTDNLQPGSYEVFSRSAHAFGVDDAGTMRWFVRFTRGPEGGAIGFHDIPVDDGKAVQTTAELGSPQSHGCIRQSRKDAIAMWGFAPVGTAVTVVA
jgi:hypothetical protein